MRQSATVDVSLQLGQPAAARWNLALKEGGIREGAGWTDIFIYPGFQFRVLDGLITNFHLPESTLIMLVSALAGYDNIMRAYRTAVQEKYRFFSFGDAMLID